MTHKVILLTSWLSLILIALAVFSEDNYFLEFQGAWSCACERCFSDPNLQINHPLNRSVETFLSAEKMITEDTFDWWRRLQHERRNLSYYKATQRRLFEVFPPIPDVAKPNPGSCRTCAVVGNSRNLKGSGYGPLIDFHDFVIRMNFGPVKGFEADVGAKTTHHVMYPESAMDLDDGTHLVLFAFKIQDIEWLIQAFTTGFNGKSYAPVKSKLRANKDLVMVVSPALMKYAHESWLKNPRGYPSTGFMTLILALHVCDEVHVFGYGADSDGNWSHYFEELKNKKLRTGLHPGSNEYEIIKQLANKRLIQLYTGH